MKKYGDTGLVRGLLWWLTKGKRKLHETREDIKQVQLIATDIMKSQKDSADNLKSIAEKAVLQQSQWSGKYTAMIDRLSKQLGELTEGPPAPSTPQRPGLKAIRFEIGGVSTLVYGGPYNDKPEGIAGVKMAEEIDLPFNVDIPTEDFSVPDQEDMHIGLIDAYILLHTRHEIYAGCMGGIGRTGLFLALMEKVYIVYQGGTWGDDYLDAVIEGLRTSIHPHAVETKEQRDYINNFRVESIVLYLTRVGIFS